MIIFIVNIVSDREVDPAKNSLQNRSEETLDKAQDVSVERSVVNKDHSKMDADKARRSLNTSAFLKDVLICSLGAYGGPEAHFSVFTDQMVTKKRYLTENELIELIALCSILPGPTSTQTIVAIGHKTGGPRLALFTMLVWALPAIMMMTLLSFLYQILARFNISGDGLRYIGPMAVGFIAVAAFRIGKKVMIDKMTVLLALLSAAVTFYIRDPWVFPVLLVIGGLISIYLSHEKNLWNRVSIKPPWAYLMLFTFFALGSLAAVFLTDNLIVHLLENFYRYGYLVFGGGQVVVPVMYSQLVEVNQYMNSQEFLTGYGLVQGLPGPMFSFAAFAGGMSARGGSIWLQVAGALAGGIGIFLPGLLLIYFVYPIWESLRQIRAIKVALRGINAIAGGMIAVAAIILMRQSGLAFDNIIVTALTVLLLISKRIPAPVLVVLVIAAGIIF